jgi:hypothetical protein
MLNRLRKRWEHEGGLIIWVVVVLVLIGGLSGGKPWGVFAGAGPVTNYPILDTITVGLVLPPTNEVGRTLVVNALSSADVLYPFEVVLAKDASINLRVSYPNKPLTNVVLNRTAKVADPNVPGGFVESWTISYHATTGQYLVDIVAVDTSGTLDVANGELAIRRKS